VFGSDQLSALPSVSHGFAEFVGHLNSRRGDPCFGLRSFMPWRGLNVDARRKCAEH